MQLTSEHLKLAIVFHTYFILSGSRLNFINIFRGEIVLKKSFCYELKPSGNKIFFICVEGKMGKIRHLNPAIWQLSGSTKSVKHTVKLN